MRSSAIPRTTPARCRDSARVRADNAAPRKTAGQTLAAERERQGLSRADVAQRLHMSAWQVEALENGDYSRLPKGTFLRGFVRNYARTLGVDVARALESLAETVPAGPLPQIVVPTQNIRFDPIGDRFASPYVRAWSVAGVTFLLALAACWWLFIRPRRPPPRCEEGALRRRPQNLAAPGPAPESSRRDSPREGRPRLIRPPARGEGALPRSQGGPGARRRRGRG